MRLRRSVAHLYLFGAVAAGAFWPGLVETQPQLTVNGVSSAVTLNAGSSATVGVTDGPGGAADWIALHAVGAPDTVYLNWRYLNGATPRLRAA